jgi:hypothetical protein
VEHQDRLSFVVSNGKTALELDLCLTVKTALELDVVYTHTHPLKSVGKAAGYKLCS